MRTLYERARPTMAALTIVMVAGLAGSRPALGDEKADVEARLQALTVQLKKHEVADTTHAATSEIGKAEALRDKARSLSDKRRDREAMAHTLDELQATLALVGAKIVHAETKAKYDAQKTKMKEATNALARTKASADDLEQQQAQLERKLGGGK